MAKSHLLIVGLVGEKKKLGQAATGLKPKRIDCQRPTNNIEDRNIAAQLANNNKID